MCDRGPEVSPAITNL